MKKKPISITVDIARFNWLQNYLSERGKSVSSFFNECMYNFSASQLESDDIKKNKKQMLNEKNYLSSSV